MNRVELIIARRGAGKSTAIAGFAARTPRLLLIDPLGEHAVGARLHSLREVADALGRMADGAPGRYVFTPSIDSDLPRVLRAVLDVPNLLVVIDEIDLYFERSPGDAGTRILRYGRHYQVGILGATRRPVDIGPHARAMLTRIAVGRLTEPRDLRWVADVGLDVERVSGLGEHACLAWDYLHPPIETTLRDLPALWSGEESGREETGESEGPPHNPGKG